MVSYKDLNTAIECFDAIECTIYIMYVRARTRDVMNLLTSNAQLA